MTDPPTSCLASSADTTVWTCVIKVILFPLIFELQATTPNLYICSISPSGPQDQSDRISGKAS